MVSTLAIAGMIVQGVLTVGFVIAAFVYFYRKERFSWKTVGVGALVFFVFSQVLEKLLHLYVLTVNPSTMEWMKRPLLFALYGCFAAGIFEEVGRWIGFKLLLKRYRERKDGIGFGLGHGGIEALLIGGVTVLQYLIYSIMINKGTFDSEIGAKLPAAAAGQLKELLTNADFGGFLLGSLERAAAILVQIALSLIVLYGIRTARKRILAYAVLVHAALDFLPGLYQAHVIPFWVTEVAVLAFGAGALWLILRSRRWYGDLSIAAGQSYNVGN